MARTKTQIKAEMTTAFMANETLAAKYGFAIGANFEDEFSLVSFENICFEIVAISHFVKEQLMGQHTTEVNQMLFNQKSGRLPWYRTMALAFLLGFDLVTDQDYFDTTGATAEQIAAAQIVKYAAVGEGDDQSTVIIKIAGENNGVLAPITPEAQEAFITYIEEIKWAGTKITVINFLPDLLNLTIQIKRDALVLDANGVSILNGNNPVNEALLEFMKELPFNGELRLSALVDKLQLVDGVVDATVLDASSAWIDEGGYGDPIPFNIATVPVSGYFEITTFDNITYVV